MESAVMNEPGVVKMTATEIAPVVPFKERTVVLEVETVPVVTVPYRIVIIGIPGEIGFTDRRSGIITVCINRCGRISGTVDNGCGSCYNDTGNRNPESDMCANEYLGIAFSSDEAGCYDGGENK